MNSLHSHRMMLHCLVPLPVYPPALYCCREVEEQTRTALAGGEINELYGDDAEDAEDAEDFEEDDGLVPDEDRAEASVAA